MVRLEICLLAHSRDRFRNKTSTWPGVCRPNTTTPYASLVINCGDALGTRTLPHHSHEQVVPETVRSNDTATGNHDGVKAKGTPLRGRRSCSQKKKKKKKKEGLCSATSRSYLMYRYLKHKSNLDRIPCLTRCVLPRTEGQKQGL